MTNRFLFACSSVVFSRLVPAAAASSKEQKSPFLLCALQMASKPITQEKVHRAKMSIENFYANLINQYEEREER